MTELILAEMWYLQIDDDRKPINLYINSTGTTRADGETVSRLEEADLDSAAACISTATLSKHAACRWALRQRALLSTT